MEERGRGAVGPGTEEEGGVVPDEVIGVTRSKRTTERRRTNYTLSIVVKGGGKNRKKRIDAESLGLTCVMGL